MQFRTSYLYILLFFNVIFYSCDFVDDQALEAAFLELNPPTLSTLNGQGESTLKIEEVYVYQDASFRGVFPVNARIPLLVNGGTSTIRLAGAIRVNGQVNTSVEYPFYEPVKIELNLEAGKTYVEDLNFKYTTTTKFDFVEGFESGNIFNFDLDGDTNTSLSVTSDDKKSGNRSGLFRGSPQRLETEVTHITKLPRSNNAGGRVFLEMDYKSEDPIAVGAILFSQNVSQTSYKIVLSPKAEWNKIYIDFTSEISSQDITDYKISFLSYYEGSSTGETLSYIDNVKLLHF